MGRPRKDRLQLPQHVHCTMARGHQYFTYHPYRGTKRAGERVKLPGTPQNDDGTLNERWWEAYRRASGQPDVAARPGTFDALVPAYKASPEWKQLRERTQKEWSRHLKLVQAKWGKLLVDGVEPKHVLTLRDTRADTPADANNLLRALSAIFTWASLRGWRSTNPCHRVPKLKIGDGWSPWPWDSIEHLKANARPHLWEAAALALYTGQRVSDVLRMRWSDLDGGLIAVVQGKTGKKLWVPLHKELAALLAVLEARAKKAMGDKVIDLRRHHKTILTTTRGKAWTVDGFKASWSAQLNEKPMVQLREQRLVFHGLRKSAVVFLLEAGCSDAETASITGQSRDMVEHYAKQVNQRRLAAAAAAILKWEAADAARSKNAESA